MEKQQMIETINEALKSVEPLKFYLDISTDEDEISHLRQQIKAQYEIINELRDELELVRGI